MQKEKKALSRRRAWIQCGDSSTWKCDIPCSIFCGSKAAVTDHADDPTRSPAAMVCRALWYGLLIFVASHRPGSCQAQDVPLDGSRDIYITLEQAQRSTVGWGTARSHQSVTGSSLAIGEETFPQGIGTHAPAEIVFAMAGKYRWFSCYAGISSEMTEKGSVIVQIWLDGAKAFESPVLRVGDAPQYLQLSVAGARELKIVATDAGDGNAADHLNLGYVRLSPAEEPPPAELRPTIERQFVGETPPPEHELSLWYRQPAQRWLEALPVGNGRLGAMVYGGIDRERIDLNESTFWSGAPDDSHDNPAAREHLAEIRSLLFAGDFARARELISQHLLGRRGNYGTHLPLGELQLQLQHPASQVENYRRELDLEEAAARVSYTIDGVQFTREVIASHPRSVVAVHLTADKPHSISLQMSFRAHRQPCQVEAHEDGTLMIAASARETKHSDGQTGVSLVGYVVTKADGGTVRAQSDRVDVTDADAVTLYVVLNTDFRGRDARQLSDTQIAPLGDENYMSLRQRHLKDFQSLFRRVAFTLGPQVAQSTDLRVRSPDPTLCALFFHYGRYLLIAGSREDSPLPTNLQGIWNDNLACNMGWTCDFHLDINQQQNYWPAEVCNLSECHAPLFRLIESLREPGRRTAQRMYGAPGWVCHVFTNPWGFTAPGWGLGWGLHPTGGIWIASHLWEHYLFTGDREFLAQHAYPTLREAAEFFLHYMVVDPKHHWLVTGPATSPENAFLTPDGQGAQSEYMGPTCDSVLVRDLFTSCIESSRILDTDAELRGRLQAALGLLPPLRSGKHGQLMEWLEDFDEAIPNHRHTTHLIALFPSCQITPDHTPELARAARVTIERRLGQQDWEDVEWSRGNAILFFARLRDGDEAYKHLLGLLQEDTDSNLLTFARGGIAGAPENIFCVDGNSAGTAGVAEMLVQSHGGVVELLPALPDSWPNGSISGLCARGGLVVDIDWHDGKLSGALLRSVTGTKTSVRYRDISCDIDLQPGESARIEP